jgi:hypothetical protein
MWCSDPFLQCLAAYGYSVVRVPRADLAPLQLLLRTGSSLERLGPLHAVLVGAPGTPPPSVLGDQPAPALSGLRTGVLDAGTGLTFLSTILEALAGRPVAIEACYRRARRVSFIFEDVLEDSISLVDLDRYLAHARIGRNNGSLGRLLDADDLYVTTAVLKSRAFSLKVTDEDGADLQVDVPVLQQVLGARVSVGSDATGELALTYRGAVRLGFGFRAVRLFYEDGRYSAFKPLRPGTAGLRGAAFVRPDWLAPSRGFARVV